MWNNKYSCDAGGCCTKTLIVVVLVLEILGISFLTILSLSTISVNSNLDLPSSFHYFNVLFNIILLVFLFTFILGLTCCRFSYEFWKNLMYSLGVSLIVILVICTLYQSSAYSRSFKISIDETLEKGIKGYGSNGKFTEAMDETQKFYHCCGINGKDDYTKNSKEIPASCNETRPGMPFKASSTGCSTFIIAWEIIFRTLATGQIISWILICVFVYVGYRWGRSEATQSPSGPMAVLVHDHPAGYPIAAAAPPPPAPAPQPVMIPVIAAAPASAPPSPTGAHSSTTAHHGGSSSHEQHHKKHSPVKSDIAHSKQASKSHVSGSKIQEVAVIKSTNRPRA